MSLHVNLNKPEKHPKFKNQPEAETIRPSFPPQLCLHHSVISVQVQVVMSVLVHDLKSCLPPPPIPTPRVGSLALLCVVPNLTSIQVTGANSPGGLVCAGVVI